MADNFIGRLVDTPIKVEPPQLIAQLVVPPEWTNSSLLKLYHACQYYRQATGLLRWEIDATQRNLISNCVDVPGGASFRLIPMFLGFFGQPCDIVELPSANAGYPNYLRRDSYLSPLCYKPVSWCTRQSLLDHLRSQLLEPQRHGYTGELP